MNLSQIKKSIFVLFVVSMVSLTLIGCPDTITQQNSMQPASLDAPKLKGKAYDGVNFITWAPVKNATMYLVYRDNCLKDVLTQGAALGGYDDLEFYDWANLEDGSIQNKVKYTYTVVAMGDQSGRGDSNTSNVTEFVLSGTDILGDSMASVTLTAKVPEVFSQVEAAKNVNAMYMEDIVHGKVAGVYFEAPDYLAKQVDFAHSEEGSGVNVFDYLASGFKGVQANGYFTVSASKYAWTPVYGGKYKYSVKTSWPNPYFKSNEVLGEIDIPAQGENVPRLTATAVEGGIKVTFNDTVGANYTLYRAEDTEASTAWTFTKVADQADFAKTECGVGGIDYAFTDTGVVYGHYYAYVLTATKDNMALSFDPLKPAVDFVQYGTALGWDPQFAALNIAGHVSLSWNVEPGITYKVLKCVVNTTDSTDPDAETGHTESYLTVNATSVAAAVNGVYVMYDDIALIPDDGYYKYTLIGTNTEGAKNTEFDSIYGYHPTGVTFDLEVAGGLETDGNGIFDKVEITVTAANDVNMTGATFYRAEVDTDNKTTSAGAFTEFVTGYTAVNLTLTDTVDNGDGTTTYTYNDDTLTEELIATKAYVYAVAVNYNNAQLPEPDNTNNVCDLCSGDLQIPDVVVELKKTEGADFDTFVHTYTLSWNAEYADTIGDAMTARDPQAAVVTVSYAYSNADDIDKVTEEWITKTVTAADFTDATYVQELVVGKDQKTFERLYYKVLFANKEYPEADDNCPTGPNYINGFKPNPAYQTTTITQIDSIFGTGATELYTTNTTSSKACIIQTNGTLEASEYIVYVTWLTNDSVFEAPIRVNTITIVFNDSGSNNETNHYYIDTNKNSFYFTQKPSDTEKVTRALVHVTNKQGKTLRSVIITADKWW